MSVLPKRIYNRFIRARLPCKIGIYNGVMVLGTVRILDHTDEFPKYKAANLKALRESVRAGDDVVVIGGGIGVTTVVSAFQTGESGSVTTFEASIDEIETIERTLKVNKVKNMCTVHHVLVGPAISIEGDMGNPTTISSKDLPECDVLEIDAEGAEVDILGTLLIRPETVIVESHPKFGGTTKRVKQELSRMEYRIESEVSDPHDGDILTAKLTK